VCELPLGGRSTLPNLLCLGSPCQIIGNVLQILLYLGLGCVIFLLQLFQVLLESLIDFLVADDLFKLLIEIIASPDDNIQFVFLF